MGVRREFPGERVSFGVGRQYWKAEVVIDGKVGFGPLRDFEFRIVREESHRVLLPLAVRRGRWMAPHELEVSREQ